VPHPLPGIDYPESWRELLAWFPDEAACLAYLERLRWPRGLRLPGLRHRDELADGRWAAALRGL